MEKQKTWIDHDTIQVTVQPLPEVKKVSISELKTKLTNCDHKIKKTTKTIEELRVLRATLRTEILEYEAEANRPEETPKVLKYEY